MNADDDDDAVCSNAERLNAAADAIRAELGSANRADSIYTIVCDIRSEEQVW